MIPKIIHCCWFGGKPLPKSVRKFMNTWRKQMPDYAIKVWTEEDFDLTDAIPYVQEAYRNSKYAFVSDYVRLYALSKYGGIYLDTDVEMLKSLDPFLAEPFMCFEDDDCLSTAIIAAETSTQWVKDVLQMYETRHFVVDGKMDLTTNVAFISKEFVRRGLVLGGKEQFVEGVKIYPAEYFSPKSWETGVYNITDKTVAVHHFAGTWHSGLTRFLSCFFSHKTISKIASIKERILRPIKNVSAKS